MDEGAKKEMEREEREEGGISVRWRRPNLGCHSPGWGFIYLGVNVFIGRDAGYTKPKARRPAGKREKKTARVTATATCFFFDGRMRGRV
jgi:hypothetical protein